MTLPADPLLDGLRVFGAGFLIGPGALLDLTEDETTLITR